MNDFDFAQAMSQGFDALEQASFENARNAFRRAETKTQLAVTSTALRELDTAETVATLNRLKTEGEQAETAEDWETALTAYQGRWPSMRAYCLPAQVSRG